MNVLRLHTISFEPLRWVAGELWAIGSSKYDTGARTYQRAAREEALRLGRKISGIPKSNLYATKLLVFIFSSYFRERRSLCHTISSLSRPLCAVSLYIFFPPLQLLHLRVIHVSSFFLGAHSGEVSGIRSNISILFLVAGSFFWAFFVSSTSFS